MNPIFNPKFNPIFKPILNNSNYNLMGFDIIENNLVTFVNGVVRILIVVGLFIVFRVYSLVYSDQEFFIWKS